VHDAADPRQVLVRQRPVEAELVAKSLESAGVDGGHPAAQLGDRRVARDQP